MNLLENELIKKYFGCYKKDCQNRGDEEMACNVLHAMQEPIKKGDKFLFNERVDIWTEQTENCEDNYFHPFRLRLPDAFQEKKEESLPCGCHKTPDPVEEKINKIMFEFWNDERVNKFSMLSLLRDLVDLARKTK